MRTLHSFHDLIFSLSTHMLLASTQNRHENNFQRIGVTITFPLHLQTFAYKILNSCNYIPSMHIAVVLLGNGSTSNSSK